jgi:hypothetical protein
MRRPMPPGRDRQGSRTCLPLHAFLMWPWKSSLWLESPFLSKALGKRGGALLAGMSYTCLVRIYNRCTSLKTCACTLPTNISFLSTRFVFVRRAATRGARCVHATHLTLSLDRPKRLRCSGTVSTLVSKERILGHPLAACRLMGESWRPRVGVPLLRASQHGRMGAQAG